MTGSFILAKYIRERKEYALIGQNTFLRKRKGYTIRRNEVMM